MGFKENFKAELSYSGMLIKEISAITGIKYRTINNYLSKRGQSPSIETGVKIAKALGVTAEYLVSGNQENETLQSDGELRAISRLAKELSISNRKFALEMLKLLLKKEN